MQLAADKRVRPIVWLVCCAIVAILSYWFPLYVDHQFDPEIDSRIGFVFFLGFPFLICSVPAAVWNLVCLTRSISHEDTNFLDYMLLAFGFLLVIIPCSALISTFGAVVRTP